MAKNNFSYHKARNNLKDMPRKRATINYYSNLLSYRLHMFNHDYLVQLTPCFSPNPQQERIMAYKKTINAIYATPKYLANEPCISYDADKNIRLITFKLISLSNAINKEKNTFKKEFVIKNDNHLLNTYQLSVVADPNNEFFYKVILHQDCYQKNKRNLVFLGRIELGKTHFQNQFIDPTFHIHIPHEETIDLKGKKGFISSVYHCEPSLFIGYNQTPLSTALTVAMQKFNIVNDLESSLDFGLKKNHSFLASTDGKKWVKEATIEKPKIITDTKVYNLLNKNPKPSQISDFIYNNI